MQGEKREVIIYYLSRPVTGTPVTAYSSCEAAENAARKAGLRDQMTLVSVYTDVKPEMVMIAQCIINVFSSEGNGLWSKRIESGFILPQRERFGSRVQKALDTREPFEPIHFSKGLAAGYPNERWVKRLYDGRMAVMESAHYIARYVLYGGSPVALYVE